MATYARVLGTARLEVDGRTEEYRPTVPAALLFYLAYQRSWVDRSAAAFLFWPDDTQSRARSNLRGALGRAPQELKAHLVVEEERLRFRGDCDARRFWEAVEQGSWLAAVQVFDGSLLEGFYLADKPEYQDWLELERERLLTHYHEAVLRAASELEAVGRHADAAGLLRDLLAREQWLAEDVLHAFLGSAARAGQRDQAVKVFETFRSTLAEEMDLDPDPETLALVDAIRRGDQLPVGNEAEPVQGARAAPEPELPTPATRFVPRPWEQNRATQLLGNPACRLLTLTGPGGTGKTRLAIEVARAHQGSFPHGMAFVPLAPVAAPEHLASAILDALKIPLFGQAEPQEQLRDFLKGRTLLLVLDNFEHLLAAAGQVSGLLAAAPDLKLLVTSRIRLNVQAEWILELAGMPVAFARADAPESGAVELFLQAARQVRPDFELEDHEAVQRILRRVGGLPLAIELAAGWLRFLKPREIAREIDTSLDLLATEVRDRPERQRSIRAVFDSSWELLPAEEQAVLRRLSVFSGGFRREAAAAVTGAALPDLAALADHSLLQVSEGRYRQHPLMREYTRAKLADHPEEQRDMRARHTSCYLELLEQRGSELRGPKARDALEVLDEERENIRAAWLEAAAGADTGILERVSGSLRTFFDMRARFAEGEDLLARAPQEAPPLLADRAWLLYRLGRFGEAESLARRALEGAGGPGRAAATAWMTHASIAMSRGDFGAARGFAEEALAAARALGQPSEIASQLGLLAFILEALGDYREAEASNREALDLHRNLGDQLGVVAGLHSLGWLHLNQGEPELAKPPLEEGLRLAQEVTARRTIPLLQRELARAEFALGAYETAGRLAAEALERMRDADARSTVPTVLVILGRVATATEDWDRADAFLREALETAWELRRLPMTLESLAALAERCAAQGRRVPWLTLLRDHPSAPGWVRIQARKLLAGTPTGGEPEEEEVPLEDLLDRLLTAEGWPCGDG